jgi:hypothetical protein
MLLHWHESAAAVWPRLPVLSVPSVLYDATLAARARYP